MRVRLQAIRATSKVRSGTATILPSRRSASVRAVGDEWGALMAASQDGNGGAYRRLLGELSAWLERYFRRRLPQAEVDDAVQETLMAVHRRRHTFDPAQPLTPWLAAIAKRKWIDQLRAIERRATGELPASLSVADHEAGVTSASVLTSLLNDLAPAQAQAILLVKLQGYTIKEASLATGQSPSAVKVNIHRGLARLAAFIEKKHDVE